MLNPKSSHFDPFLPSALAVRLRCSIHLGATCDLESEVLRSRAEWSVADRVLNCAHVLDTACRPYA